MRDYLWVIFAGHRLCLSLQLLCGPAARGGQLAWRRCSFWPSPPSPNIVLDLLFVVAFQRGVAGAAEATVIAQAAVRRWASPPTPLSSSRPSVRTDRYMKMDRPILREIFQYAFLTCIQQSVMNFGILLVQGLVNSFGTAVMAAFAAAVKIDAFAYMPVQDFGNAFSTFAAQNFGARKEERIRRGIRSAIGVTVVFCLIVSALVFVFARQLMLIFVQPQETEILAVGAQYLRIEGAFYCGIGCLFLLYGFYRGGAPSGHLGGAHRPLAGHKGGAVLPCWPPFRPSGWWGSGGPSRLAGCLPTWRGCSITKSLKSSCWNNCKNSEKRPGKGSLFLCLLGGSSL